MGSRPRDVRSKLAHKKSSPPPRKNPPSGFGSRLKTLRVSEPRWSQEKLAQLAGVHGQTISRLESGATQSVSLKIAEQLAGALGVPLLDLLTGAGR